MMIMIVLIAIKIRSSGSIENKNDDHIININSYDITNQDYSINDDSDNNNNVDDNNKEDNDGSDDDDSIPIITIVAIIDDDSNNRDESHKIITYG